MYAHTWFSLEKQMLKKFKTSWFISQVYNTISYKGKTVQIIRNYSNKKTPKESNVAKFKKRVFQQIQPKELSEDCIGNQKPGF